MQRRILIIDDHDDLATATEEVFTHLGHIVDVVDNREDALRIDDIEDYDLVITDLDVGGPSAPHTNNGTYPRCLPKVESTEISGHVKAFKISAMNYRRDDFKEDELR